MKGGPYYGHPRHARLSRGHSLPEAVEEIPGVKAVFPLAYNDFSVEAEKGDQPAQNCARYNEHPARVLVNAHGRYCAQRWVEWLHILTTMRNCLNPVKYRVWTWIQNY